jgi:apolipoprotein N-acyltransferase
MARAVNMGISAVIDGNGRVLRPVRMNSGPPYRWELRNDRVVDLPLSEWADYKKVPGVLVANIPIDQRTSLYSLWGDWLPYTCLAVVGVGLVWARLRRRRRAALAGAGGIA